MTKGDLQKEHEMFTRDSEVQFDACANGMGYSEALKHLHDKVKVGQVVYLTATGVRALVKRVDARRRANVGNGYGDGWRQVTARVWG
jgi:hypothetical protein